MALIAVLTQPYRPAGSACRLGREAESRRQPVPRRSLGTRETRRLRRNERLFRHTGGDGGFVAAAPAPRQIVEDAADAAFV